MLSSNSPGEVRQSQSQLSQDWGLPSAGRRYRSAQALPYELRQHCIIYFEEGLYSQALTLLTNLLVSCQPPALSSNTSLSSPAYVPSYNVLALLSTLAVHPSLTTRSTLDEKLDAADHSLQFLALVNTLIGPANANFGQAFQNVETKRSSSYRRSGASHRLSGGPASTKRDSGATSMRNRCSGSPESEGDDDNDYLQTTLASDNSLWARAVDFWHIVGWSFNCAIRWKLRWGRWKLLLQLMMQILEDDWTERMVRFRSSSNVEQESCYDSESIIRNSLIMQFLDDCKGGSGGSGRRRVMRAIFANGNDKDMAEFKEIFPRETAEKKQQEDFAFHVDRKVNIDEGQFGDYYEPDDEDAFDDYADGQGEVVTKGTRSHSTSKRSLRSVVPNSTAKAPIEDAESIYSYGGHEAVQLRRRLLILLTKVTEALPNDFINMSGLFDILEEYVRPLPIPVYVVLITPTVQSQQDGEGGSFSFSPSSHIALLQELARNLLPPSAPRNRDNFLTAEVLMRYYLPFPAGSNSADDNAKLSIVLESMIRLLKKYVGLDGAEGRFRKGVEIGIQERTARANASNRKKWDETEGTDWLKASEARLKLLVRMVESGV